jgi:hypothetical protein
MANENTFKIMDIETLLSKYYKGNISQVELLERISKVINKK